MVSAFRTTFSAALAINLPSTLSNSSPLSQLNSLCQSVEGNVYVYYVCVLTHMCICVYGFMCVSLFIVCVHVCVVCTCMHMCACVNVVHNVCIS